VTIATNRLNTSCLFWFYPLAFFCVKNSEQAMIFFSIVAAKDVEFLFVKRSCVIFYLWSTHSWLILELLMKRWWHGLHLTWILVYRLWNKFPCKFGLGGVCNLVFLLIISTILTTNWAFSVVIVRQKVILTSWVNICVLWIGVIISVCCRLH